MKKIILFLFCAAVLSTFIQGYDILRNLRNELNHMAMAGNVLINDVFKPTIYGGGRKLVPSSLVYKGILIPAGAEVAMKFTLDFNRALNEYKMYTYLKAINNKTVEEYGIPTVYYFGQWNSFYLLGTTFLHKYHEEGKTNKWKFHDICLFAREMIKTLKYIHSCGVRKGDHFSANDILIDRNYRFFLTDYKHAEAVYPHGSESQPLAKVLRKDLLRFKDIFRDSADLILDGNFDSQIKTICKKFGYFTNAIDMNNSSTTKVYDQIYEFLGTYLTPETQMISFLTEGQRSKRKNDTGQPTRIYDLPNPLDITELTYPPVDVDFFNTFYEQWRTSSAAHPFNNDTPDLAEGRLLVELDVMAWEGELINEEIRPSIEGYYDRTEFILEYLGTYVGDHIQNGEEVIMKFIFMANVSNAEQEISDNHYQFYCTFGEFLVYL